MSNNEEQGMRTTGPLSPLFATTIMILPRWDVRVEEEGEGAREPSGWKVCRCGRLREWGTWPRRNLRQSRNTSSTTTPYAILVADYPSS